ncbi:MAG: DUF262 domain-containing protein [Janthinobacterium sp.]|jgi:hypothetical protein
MASSSELSVTGITIESLYNNYSADKYKINRRYQRKLVWTTDDKERLIESIFSSFPIPLLLFADIKEKSEKYYEIIDGMQRINAIIYFIENRISYDGKYFDLDSLSATKSKLDGGTLTQRLPKLSRSSCLDFTSYIVPSSIYEFENQGQIDEVFKRINSMGRYLSRQELRVAGVTGEFSTLVRKISANIRGDSSQSDIFSLDKMPYISLAFSENDVGIQVQDIFWIKQGIISKEWLRESRDEEIVCDIIASVALQEIPPSNTDIFNEYYGMPIESARSVEINAAISRIDSEVIESQILETLDEIRRLFQVIGKTFVDHCFTTPPPRAPRYFTAFFLAVHDLIFKKNRKITDYIAANKKLRNICDKMDVGTGGNWSAASKERNIELFTIALNKCCEDRNIDDPTRTNWTTRIENILNQSLIEQQLYDFKIGFTDLGASPTYSESTVAKIVETLTAMTNIGKGKVGYVIVGIADKQADAKRIEEKYSTTSIERYKRHIVGIEHDCTCLGLNEDTLFSKICTTLDRQPVEKSTIKDIKTNLKLVTYQSKSIFIFQLISGTSPRLYNNKYFLREGTSNREVPMSEVSWLFSQFTPGN